MAFVTGWDEGVLGMQVGEVARLRVMCIYFSVVLIARMYNLLILHLDLFEAYLFFYPEASLCVFCLHQSSYRMNIRTPQ